MFDYVVQQTQNDFISWVSFGADLCILGITLYTTWKTFIEKKIKLLSYKPNFRMFGGDYIAIVVENSSLSPISVDKIDIVYGNYLLNIQKYDSPLILEPQQAKKIEMEPFSKLSILSLSELDKLDFFLIFYTSKGKIISKFKRMKNKYNKKVKYEIITVSRTIFNGQLITPDIKYALITNTNGKEKTILINDGGIMDLDLYGYNAIPRNDINNLQLVKQHIKNIIEEFNPKQIYSVIPLNQNKK